jgi:hypothetical protein
MLNTLQYRKTVQFHTVQLDIPISYTYFRCCIPGSKGGETVQFHTVQLNLPISDAEHPAVQVGKAYSSIRYSWIYLFPMLNTRQYRWASSPLATVRFCTQEKKLFFGCTVYSLYSSIKNYASAIFLTNVREKNCWDDKRFPKNVILLTTTFVLNSETEECTSVQVSRVYEVILGQVQQKCSKNADPTE